METETQTYNDAMTPARDAIGRSETLALLTDPNADSDILLAWLINFSTRGVRMTEPVEGWISRAGRRCQEVGLVDLGRMLMKHASQERDHHLMMIEDAKRLVARWNETHERSLDVDDLMARAPTKATEAYVQLHEDVIASDTPYLQVAIEREIEGLSLAAGPAIIARTKEVLGESSVQDITFITDHVTLDVGHTAFNEKLIGLLLRDRPDALQAMIETGTTALKTYLAFMSDCISGDFVERRRAG